MMALVQVGRPGQEEHLSKQLVHKDPASNWSQNGKAVSCHLSVNSKKQNYRIGMVAARGWGWEKWGDVD